MQHWTTLYVVVLFDHGHIHFSFWYSRMHSASKTQLHSTLCHRLSSVIFVNSQRNPSQKSTTLTTLLLTHKIWP